MKGEILSMLSTLASPGPTLVPPSMILGSAVISVMPRLSPMGTLRAWKQGSCRVPACVPCGDMKSQEGNTAGAGWTCDANLCAISIQSALVKTTMAVNERLNEQSGASFSLNGEPN